MVDKVMRYRKENMNKIDKIWKIISEEYKIRMKDLENMQILCI